MVSPCTRVELVNDEPQTDDQVIDHESFKGSLESETVFNAHEGTEDRKEHDHELRDNSDTDNGCFNFFEYLLLRMNYHTDEDSQQDPDKHKSIDDDQNQTCRELVVEPGENGDHDRGVHEDNY